MVPLAGSTRGPGQQHGTQALYSSSRTSSWCARRLAHFRSERRRCEPKTSHGYAREGTEISVDDRRKATAERRLPTRCCPLLACLGSLGAVVQTSDVTRVGR
jgi:hypothetical protein